MAQQTSNFQDELEQLRRRFDEFRKTQPLRSRLPEPLWAAAAELAALWFSQTSNARCHGERGEDRTCLIPIAGTCLDHVIVFNERSLYRHVRDFLDYYHRTRTHLGLHKDTPESRLVQSAEAGSIISIPEVGGLHHRYERRVA
jgi:hypothetical protein